MACTASNLYRQIKSVLANIPIDAGGGCSRFKAFLLAELIRRFQLKRTVDIGVYRGRSLLPQGIAHRLCGGGIAYGIDPWSDMEARQCDTPEKRTDLDKWMKETDFASLYHGVLDAINALDLKSHVQLIRAPSSEAISRFETNQWFDLVHIDGNHDTSRVVNDVVNYCPRIKSAGFVILDDISWKSVKPAQEHLANDFKEVFRRVKDGDDFAIYWKHASTFGAWRLRILLHSLALEYAAMYFYQGKD